MLTLSGFKIRGGLTMYLLDTNVISEIRKQERANPGVRNFFQARTEDQARLFLSALTIGELRRGIELLRQRNDKPQAEQLEVWLERVLSEYEDNILPLDIDTCQLWGRLRVPHPENELDKLIAASALIYDLTVVTRNIDHFSSTGVKVLNPFA